MNWKIILAMIGIVGGLGIGVIVLSIANTSQFNTIQEQKAEIAELTASLDSSLAAEDSRKEAWLDWMHDPLRDTATGPGEISLGADRGFWADDEIVSLHTTNGTHRNLPDFESHEQLIIVVKSWRKVGIRTETTKVVVERSE